MAAMQRKKFNEMPAPVNYVAGLGRGATGFTTRSDIGPARAPADGPPPGLGGPPPGYVAGGGRGLGGTGPGMLGQQPPPGYVAGGGRGMGGTGPGMLPPSEVGGLKRAKPDDDNDNEDYSESNYDEFLGYGGGFSDASSVYDQDDKEADDVWESIDNKMDSKRKARREKVWEENVQKVRAERPKIQQQFIDVKRELATVSFEEWDAIPDPGDHRNKKRHMPERYVPVPDSLLESARNEQISNTSIDARGGMNTPAGMSTPMDLTQVGATRNLILAHKLQGVSDSVTGQTVVDPKGYLTDLSSIKITSDAEVGDIKKARLLLQSVTTTNPKHPPGWIAYARLEEVAGKIVQARKLIAKGCEECPDNEDVWLENARLQTPENAKIIIAKAVATIPNSVKLWLYGANLETETKAKGKVLRKGLEFIPNAVRLWKAVIELEEPEDAKVLLGRAVECVPDSVDMWLALARLETYENAKQVLNRARTAVPTDPLVWIAAATLEESNGNEDATRMIIKRAVKSLDKMQVIISRDSWIKEAENAEKTGFNATCQALVTETIGFNVEDEDRKKTWMEDAENCLARGSVQTARAIYAHALIQFPGKKSLWLRNAHIEKSHGTRESLDQLLARAVRHCPQAEILWLMGAKEKWLAGEVNAARKILESAFEANPDSEQIWLAAVKLESENAEPARARALLKRARERSSTQRVWLKSAILERELGDVDHERTLLDEALVKYPQFDKLWMMRGQLEERSLGYDAAREIYQKGLRNCSHSVGLWQCATRLEETAKLPSKARALLEKARAHNPKNPEIWLEAVRAEVRQGPANKKIALNMLAKALQECPTSGILWAESIEMETRAQQKARGVDALKRCDNDPHVITALAKIFWFDRKVDKARSWFNRAVTLNPDLGDAWANYYKFEVQHGSADEQQAIVKRCAEAEPHHGENWCKVSKAVENSRLKTEQILKKVALVV